MRTRYLHLQKMLEKAPVFLLGPRDCGKMTLVETALPNARIYNLLDDSEYQRIRRQPSTVIREDCDRPVVIVGIHRFPDLIAAVSQVDRTDRPQFLFTGNHCRHLNMGAIDNATELQLLPLTTREIEHFDLMTYCNSGGLPAIYGQPDYRQRLQHYLAFDLFDDIRNAALARNGHAFRMFVDAMARYNGKEINYQSVASDCGVPPRTVQNYVELLKTTFIGYSIDAFTMTRKRTPIRRAKHYLFDIGIVNSLCHRGQIEVKSELFERTFEQFIVGEVRAWVVYGLRKNRLCHWRSTSNFAVDLIIDRKLALTIVASETVSDRHLRGIRALKEEGLIRQYFVICLEPQRRQTVDGIVILPWALFLDRLWQMES